jgi:alkylation response protein AidB-like acyl-CoA dehydrogenase
MDFHLSESETKLVSMVRDFCVREVKPHAMEWDRDERFPREVVAQLGELGLLRRSWAARRSTRSRLPA